MVHKVVATYGPRTPDVANLSNYDHKLPELDVVPSDTGCCQLPINLIILHIDKASWR